MTKKQRGKSHAKDAVHDERKGNGPALPKCPKGLGRGRKRHQRSPTHQGKDNGTLAPRSIALTPTADNSFANTRKVVKPMRCYLWFLRLLVIAMAIVELYRWTTDVQWPEVVASGILIGWVVTEFIAVFFPNDLPMCVGQSLLYAFIGILFGLLQLGDQHGISLNFQFCPVGAGLASVAMSLTDVAITLYRKLHRPINPAEIGQQVMNERGWNPD